MNTSLTKHVVRLVGVVLSAGMVFGCAGMELNQKSNLYPWGYIHKEIQGADRAVEAARKAGKDRECPAEFKAAEDLKNKAYSVYASCQTDQGIALANEATAKANALCPPKPRVEPAPVAAPVAPKPKAAVAPAPPPPPPPPADTDGDGVVDSADKCPGTPRGVAVDADGCPLDTDGDGVPDYLDKCPGTPAGVKVDQDGCPLDTDRDGVYDYLDKCPGTPAGVKVDQNGCPLDTDGDGVYDYLDKCPGTPAGVKVDQNGCPLDTDGDGVYDYLDKCPNTPKGLKVDKDGCAIEKLRMTLKIEFDTAKAVVKPQYADELGKLADFMKKYPETRVTIEGHTDSVASAPYNLKLSQQRADAVKKYLVEKFGIDASRLSATGYGLTKPIADNKTKEGKAMNRRTEAVADEVVIKR